jgi:capsular polysaccharide biosynthesis protein
MTPNPEPRIIEETLPAIRMPAAWMNGRSRFVNIYAPEVERIWLPEGEVPPHPVRLVSMQGDSRDLLEHLRARDRTPGARARLWFWAERIRSGRVLDLGQRFVYDARWVFNGNLAHILQHHVASLGFIRSRLGIGPGDCLVVLEQRAPALGRELLSLLGYETLQTDRAVRGQLVSLQQLKDVPYHLLPYAATLRPTLAHPSSISKVFIPRRGNRRLLNQSQIQEVAEAHGYTTVYLEDLPLIGQIGLMRHATSILAVHGAALGHLALRCVSQGDAPIDLIEILTPALVTDIFRKYVAAQGGAWRGCRGRMTSEMVKVVEDDSNYKAAADWAFSLDPMALEVSLSAQ